MNASLQTRVAQLVQPGPHGTPARVECVVVAAADGVGVRRTHDLAHALLFRLGELCIDGRLSDATPTHDGARRVADSALDCRRRIACGAHGGVGACRRGSVQRTRQEAQLLPRGRDEVLERSPVVQCGARQAVLTACGDLVELRDESTRGDGECGVQSTHCAL